jgi:hypothetical protein
MNTILQRWLQPAACTKTPQDGYACTVICVTFQSFTECNNHTVGQVPVTKMITWQKLPPLLLTVLIAGVFGLVCRNIYFEA